MAVEDLPMSELKISQVDEQNQNDDELCNEFNIMNLKNDISESNHVDLKTGTEKEKEFKKEEPERNEKLENWRKSSMLQGVGPFLQLLADANEGDVPQSTSNTKTSSNGNKYNDIAQIILITYTNSEEIALLICKM